MAAPSKHGKNKAGPQQECEAGKIRFFENIAIYVKMAAVMDTHEDFLMALSSHESGWLDNHNAGLHNLFGITKGGGNNLHFGSYQKCADYWVKNYDWAVHGTHTMDAFIRGLRRIPYNSEDPDYDKKLAAQYTTIRRWKGICHQVPLPVTLEE